MSRWRWRANLSPFPAKVSFLNGGATLVSGFHLGRAVLSWQPLLSRLQASGSRLGVETGESKGRGGGRGVGRWKPRCQSAELDLRVMHSPFT